MTDSHIESLYQEARSALKARDYEYAIELLKRVLVVDENYKDTSRLLEKAVKLRKLRWYKNPRLWGVLGLIVVFVLGIMIAPKIGGLFASPAPANTLSPTGTNTPSPTSTLIATPTRTPRPTSTVTPLPSWVADFAQPILDAIANRLPNYMQDFSNTSSNWDGEIADWHFAEITNGTLVQTIPSTQPNARIFIPCCYSYQNIVFTIDVNISGIRRESLVEINFEQSQMDNASLIFELKNDGRWFIYKDGNNIDNGQQQISNKEKVTIMLLFNKGKYAFYINDIPISYGNYSAEKVRTSISFRGWSDGAATAIGKFDNISVWNLDAIPNLP
jgi:hypothetical protein